MVTKIGDLNRRINILELNESRDSFGGIVGNWEVVSSLWAKIEPKEGRENLVNDQVQATQYVVLKVRFNENISLDNRIEYNGKFYEILSVKDVVTGHIWTEIEAKEIIDGIFREATQS